MIPMESVQSYEILSILQSIHNIFVAEQHIFKEITILQLIISEIGDKNEKGDITRLFYELCPLYNHGSLIHLFYSWTLHFAPYDSDKSKLDSVLKYLIKFRYGEF